MPLLEVRDLQTHFSTPNGVVKAVNNVHFSIEKGEVMALVGESGSGKSITGLSILGLVPKPNGNIVGGQILFEGNDLVLFNEKQLGNIRGRDISMIFQNPLTALDPLFTIGNQMVETISYRQNLNAKVSRKEAENLLDLVGIHETKRVFESYPHELSGGMRQRVMIAMALSCKPKLLIADEPTTALDATIQKQILMLLKKVNKQLNTTLLLITHDFGVVSSLSDSVAVMYAGGIVEYGTTKQILSSPEHPYTRGLMGAMPSLGNGEDKNRRRRLIQIDGSPPDLLQLPKGCSFSERCKEARDICFERVPKVSFHDGQHLVRCFNREEGSDGYTISRSEKG